MKGIAGYILVTVAFVMALLKNVIPTLIFNDAQFITRAFTELGLTWLAVILFVLGLAKLVNKQG